MAFQRQRTHLFQKVEMIGKIMAHRFSIACKNLSLQLKTLGYVVPNELLISSPQPKYSEDQPPIFRTKFYSLALNHGLDYVERWAYELQSRPPEPDWHLVDPSHILSECEAPEDRLLAAKSKAEALAYIIDRFDYLSIEPDEVISQGEVITFFKAGNRLAEIRKYQLSGLVPALSMRIRNQLEKAFWCDSTESIGRKLNKAFELKGLRKNCDEESNGSFHHPLLMSTKSLVNQMARFLPKVVSEKIPRHELLNLTASFHGFDKWQHFVAKEKKYGGNLLVPYIVYDKQNSAASNIEFCLGIEQALLSFSKRFYLSPHSSFEIGNTMRAHASTQKDSTEVNAKHLLMTELDLVDSSELPIEKAKQFLQSQKLENRLKDHLGASLPIEQKLQKRANRRGSNTTDPLLLGDWLIFSEPGRNTYDEFVMERYDPVSNQRIERISGSQYKCSFVTNPEDGRIWLSIDWDNAPTYLVEGLNSLQLNLIKEQFFDPQEDRKLQPWKCKAS